jgi:adenosylmethionine-8-amino-7-oxononanoate aminotransferase
MDELLPIADLDRRFVFHPFTALAAHERTGGRMIVEGDGVRLRDDHGREYLDAMAACGVSSSVTAGSRSPTRCVLRR